MNNKINIPVIFYHKPSNQFYYGTIIDIDFKNNLNVILYRSPINPQLSFKTHVSYNNTISLDITDHPIHCSDTIPA